MVLAPHLGGDSFSDEVKGRSFAYYEGLTVCDASLSSCAEALFAAEVGLRDR